MARERWSARRFLKLAPVAGLLALVLPTLPTSSAQASEGWRLCNETSFVLEAATGRPENQSVIVEGWTRLRPGECRVALPSPLKPGIYFTFARSSKAHRGGQRVWNGDVPLCVDTNGSFAVENPSSCVAMGLEQRNFQAVRIDKRTGGSMTFLETEPYNKGGQSAQNAGIQRLLDDAGISTDTIDGYLGRESRAAITAFLNERREPPNTPNTELIDILEDVARNRSLEVGMMLCNRTDHRITAAMAWRRAEGWESRGWWTLEAGLCVRTVDQSLIATPHYVFAEMETPQGVRLLNGAETIFCTSRAKFAVLGRENCDTRRYRPAKFVETGVPEDGKLVYEFFDRAFGQPQKKQS
jgi:uncharacterized membrane protein